MAKKIMIQGTMSNAGKSLLSAGLCRIFKEDGYRVAPFKSQNMALNSFITKDGLEMGRAQAMQAEACGEEPSVYMNPILLKPVTDMGSQVIVNGEVRFNMGAVPYFQYRKQLIPDILYALEQLEKQYDIIVIEGAGSPAEINLKKDDIVNMGLAKMAKAPVLLAGDIDRGGVFAQLVGTLTLLEKEERAFVKGLIINKFRGDKKILDPGVDMLKRYTDIPVLGVVPYMQVDIEEEDSLSERLEKKTGSGEIDIAVIRFPKISNYTDFHPLELMEHCFVRYVTSAAELKNPDIVMLPGTKNTIEDLKWMRQSGLEGAILRLVQRKTLLFGICGGYQMLGEYLEDPLGVEGGGSIRGMGLLPIITQFGQQKTRVQVKGAIEALAGPYEELSGAEVKGYEIHMGTSRICGEMGADPAVRERSGAFSKLLDGTDKKRDGFYKENVCGTYIHGIFDSVGMQGRLRDLLYRRKGIAQSSKDMVSFRDYKEKQYEMLAKSLRQCLDMKMIRQILEEGLK